MPDPVVMFCNASSPTAVLFDPLVEASIENFPIAVFCAPVVLLVKVLPPIPTLFAPVFTIPAFNPKNIFPDVSIDPATVLFTFIFKSFASVVPKKLVPGVVPELPVVDHPAVLLPINTQAAPS